MDEEDRRRRNALRMSLRRNRETSEERAQRQAADRERVRARRAQQSQSQEIPNPRRRTAEVAMLDVMNRDPDDIIDPATYIARLVAHPRTDTSRMRRLRESEMERERGHRLLQAATHNATVRDQETEEDRAIRLERDRFAHFAGRLQETLEERQSRIDESADRMRNLRQNQTQNEEMQRRRQNTAQHQDARQMQRQAVPDLPAAYTSIYPALHYCGPMIEECQSCHALFFPNEARSVRNRETGLRTYNKCCGNGRITVPLFRDFPPTLKNLFVDNHDTAKHFKTVIRSYNSALATASLNCKNELMIGRGPGVFKIHGSVQHKIGPALPGANQRPSYGQLWFMDTNQANQERMGIRSNQNCHPQLMHELADLLGNANPYANGYKMMGDVYREEATRARQNGTEVPQVKMVFINRACRDQRRFNAPTANEVAAIFVAVDDPSPQEYTTVSLTRGFQTLRVGDQKLDSMTYPLFFPTGRHGWHTQLESRNARGQTKRVTIKDYYSYLSFVRQEFSPLHWGSKLFQQFLVDVAVRIEMNDLSWLRHNQVCFLDDDVQAVKAQIRADLYQNLQQFVADGEEGLAGTRIVLPASHMGSPRFYAQCYADTMALVTRFGKPDVFLTMTTNPDWIEIKENLGPGQTASDRPDIVTRVFNMKLKEIIHDIKEKKILGGVDAFADVVEFQKRGLPHVHMLTTLTREFKLDSADQVDQLICAELPDPETEPQLFHLVTKFMIHRKCGQLNPNSPCMKDGKCSKGFPKSYAASTDISGDGYPVYRRRDDGRYFDKDGHRYTNADVVPYNKWLLLKYACHINLEFCFLIHSVKYLYKYIYKGSDAIEIELRSERRSANGGAVDEIEDHIEGRYLCAPEAIHRLLSYPIHERSHSIEHLEVHLPSQQRVRFRPGEEAHALQDEAARRTTLTEYFKLNNEWHEKELRGEPLGSVDPRNYYYSEIPEHFVWQQSKKWTVRKITTKPKIGRLLHASVKDVERHCLRRLLLARKGAISFEDLRTVNGNLLPTFEAAAIDMGLIHTDHHFEDAMNDGVQLQMPRELRKLFASLLAFVQNANAQAMWNMYKDAMSEDFTHRGRSLFEANCLAYYDLMEQLNTAGIDITSRITIDNLPDRDTLGNLDQDSPDYVTIGQNFRASLRPGQQRVVEAVVDRGEKLVFIDGPGGTGKTFIYSCIYNILKGQGKNVVCLAWTGIAANLLPEGKTVCSCFKLDTAADCKKSTLAPNTKEGRNLEAVDVFIIDEVSMLSYWVLDAINSTLQDVHNNQEPFGGKTVLLGGDFRQLLPIPPKGSGLRPQETCLKNSQLFSRFCTFKLTENMRVEGDAAEWKEFLLKVGEGRLDQDEQGRIELPAEILTTGDLIDDVFEGIYDQPDHLNRRATLCPKNKDVNDINNTILDRMTSEEKVYYSVDSIDSDRPADDLRYPDEFLHTLEPSGFPPHRLRLKLGCIVILLRNINVSQGLCNGTRFQVVGFTRNLLVCRFINGIRNGQRILIPRISILSGKTIGIPLSRRQFPVKLAFAMSITKSQGQSLEKVGISLKEPVFSHGMLYVALSRCITQNGVRVFTLPSDGNKAVNIVDPAVLDSL